jgi:hypothetical protein
MWRSPPPKGILGDPHLAHMIDSRVPSSRDLHRSESVRPVKLNTRSAVALVAGSRNIQELTIHDSNARKTILSDVPPPDQDVNILGDVWSILVLANYNSGLYWRHLEPVLNLQSCFVSFRCLRWFTTWWYSLRRRYDPTQQTTTIRRRAKFECELNTRKERETYMLLPRKLDMEMLPDTLKVVGVNELFVVVTVDVSFTTEQAVSGTLGTHRCIRSNSNTDSISTHPQYPQYTVSFEHYHQSARSTSPRDPTRLTLGQHHWS